MAEQGPIEDTVLGKSLVDFHKKYLLAEEIGSGATSIVHVCIDRTIGERFACKIIPKKYIQYQEEVLALRTEVRCMMELQEDCSVVELVEAIEDGDCVYFVMELCEHGDLFDLLMRTTKFRESEAARILRRLCLGIRTCHARGILHRDLKPENIFVAKSGSALERVKRLRARKKTEVSNSSVNQTDDSGNQTDGSEDRIEGGGSSVLPSTENGYADLPIAPLVFRGEIDGNLQALSLKKAWEEKDQIESLEPMSVGNIDFELRIGDFGVATYAKPDESLSMFCGSVFYVSPEVIIGDYNRESDVWSLGVMLYVLLSGRCPFGGRSESQTYLSILQGHFTLVSKHWTNISELAKDLIVKMLTVDKRKRITVEGILNHPWVVRHDTPPPSLISPLGSVSERETGPELPISAISGSETGSGLPQLNPTRIFQPSKSMVIVRNLRRSFHRQFSCDEALLSVQRTKTKTFSESSSFDRRTYTDVMSVQDEVARELSGDLLSYYLEETEEDVEGEEEREEKEAGGVEGEAVGNGSSVLAKRNVTT